MTSNIIVIVKSMLTIQGGIAFHSNKYLHSDLPTLNRDIGVGFGRQKFEKKLNDNIIRLGERETYFLISHSKRNFVGQLSQCHGKTI